MKIIGLTGGIGVGKSTVSAYLKEKGCVIIDADEISRNMTRAGSPALKDIEEAFGREYILPDGSLDRKALGDLVFKDKNRLNLLQSIITKKVIEDIEREISALRERGGDETVILDAPLLFECDMGGLCDENWLVVSDLNVRLARVSKRDNLSEEQILARIDNQMSQSQKEEQSQCIIDNSSELEELYEQIDGQLERIRNER